MPMIFKKISVIFLFVLLAACQGITNPGTSVATLDSTSLFATSVAEVTEADQRTQTALSEFAMSESLTQTAMVTPTAIPTLDRTRPIVASPTKELDCDIAKAGSPFDITMKDYSPVKPGQGFTKTWRLQNAGSCKWTRLYTLVFFSGNSLSAIQTHNLAGEVLPGSSIDLSIDMIAPNTPGIYQSNWMFQNEKGELFGIGPNGDAPFWVIIEVTETWTPTITSTPTPTQTPTPMVPVYRQGTIGLKSGDKFDLDENLFITNSQPFDVTYNYLTNTHVILPGEDVSIILYGNQLPGFKDCQDATLSSEGIAFTNLVGENHLCYKTDQGRFGRLSIIGYDEINKILTINFVTWVTP